MVGGVDLLRGRLGRLALAGLLGLLAACGRGEAASGSDGTRRPTSSDETERPARAPRVVDSIRPIAEEMARFRATLEEEEPEGLRGGAESREVLVARFVEALARRDSVELGRMLLSREEFALLYYPHTKFTAKPYELSPQLLWFQMQNRTGRGIVRALARYGGRSLEPLGHRCAAEPDREGPNLMWRDCVVLLAASGGDTVAVGLFGLILERHGRFKFVSYSNDL